MMVVEPILSKEEVAAILAEERGPVGERRALPAMQRLNPLTRGLETFGEEQSRLASTVHQRPIRFSLLRAETMPIGAFATALDPQDRAFTLRVPAAPGTGVMVVGRSVLFGWLAMAFGAPPNLAVPLPPRAFTRIEVRLLRTLAEELIAQLNRSLGEHLPGMCELGELLEPDLLMGIVSPRILAAAFEIEGAGPPGRLRVGFPETWIPDVEHRASPVEGRIPSDMLLEVPFGVSAEVGSIESTFARLGSLQVGDVLPVDGHGGGRIVVKVAGEPRFVAAPGSAGATAAVQIISEQRK